MLTNDKYIPVKKNDIFVGFPGDLHGIVASVDDPIQYDHLAFIIDKKELGEPMRKIAIEHADPRVAHYIRQTYTLPFDRYNRRTRERADVL